MGQEAAVNTEQLQKDIGRELRLRPHVLVVKHFLRQVAVFTSGDPMFERRLIKTDYKWRLERATRAGVTLHCLYTDHEITLGNDNVREYRTPDFLLLRCQLTLDGNKVHIEPIG